MYFHSMEVASLSVAGMSSFSFSFEMFLLANSLLEVMSELLLPELSASLKPVLELPLVLSGEVLRTLSPGDNIVAGVGGKLLIGESMKHPRAREVSLDCQLWS